MRTTSTAGVAPRVDRASTAGAAPPRGQVSTAGATSQFYAVPPPALLVLWLLALWFLVAPSRLRAEAPSFPGDQSSLGIALAGGGALGFAHIGVLQVLEEHGLSPEIVVGTSIGSIVGALYAAGYSPEEIIAITESVDWNAILLDERERSQLNYQERTFDRLYRGRLTFSEGALYLGSGASPAQAVVRLLDELLRYYAPTESFDQLPRRLAIVTTDLVTGEEVVYRRGDIKSAVRASIAVPGAFDPLFYDDRFLIDGGWTNNVPVDVAREMDASHVIAVNLDLLDLTAEEMQNITVVLNQASRILRQEQIKTNLDLADIVITPDLRGFTRADFGRAPELIARGRAAAEAQLDEILALRKIVGPRTGEPWRTPHPEVDRTVKIRSVNVRTPSFIDLLSLRGLDEELVGRELTVGEIQQRVYRRYEADRYRFISYDLVPTGKPGEYDIDLYPLPGPANAAELWIGVGVRTQLVESLYTRGLFHLYSRVPLGEGGRRRPPELRVEGWLTDVASARVGLDLPIVGGISLQPRGYVLSDPVGFYDDRTLEALYFRRRAGGELNAVFESPRLWHIQLGGFSEWRWTERQQGADLLDQDGDLVGGAQFDAHLDLLDRGVFPRRGTDTSVRSQVWWSDPTAEPLLRGELEHRFFVPLGRKTVVRFDLRGGSDFDTGVDEADRFYVGGVEDLPGFLYQERSGRHLLVAGLGTRHELFRLPFAIGDAGYLLLRGRVGRVWDDEITSFWTPGTNPEIVAGGMVGLGFGTPLGAFTLGVGVNDDLRFTTFFVLGPAPAPNGSSWRW